MGATDLALASALVKDIAARGGRVPHLRAALEHPAQLAALVRVCRSLPVAELRLSGGTCCAPLRRRLLRRTLGVPTELLAPAVLPLQPTLEATLAGRGRQAVRTGLRHAERAGVVVSPIGLEDRVAVLAEVERSRSRELSTDAFRAILEPETSWFLARSPGGDPLALAVGLACRHAARLELLHGAWNAARELVSPARYAVHTAVVAHAVELGAPLVVVDSPLGLEPGTQHFQHVLGYSATRLRSVWES